MQGALARLRRGRLQHQNGVGVTLHEALTGTPTFDPDRPAADRPAPTDLPSGAVAELVTELLHTDPGARPTLAEALRTFSALGASAAPEAWPPWSF